MDPERIKKQAKELLDSFAKALEKVEKQAKEEIGVDRDDFERKEREKGKERNNDFRQAFLKNAPAHNDDFIIAERGEWK